jgi:hypothetical protein
VKPERSRTALFGEPVMPYLMPPESSRTPVISSISLPSYLSRALRGAEEVGWLLVFVLMVPAVVLLIGLPVALVVRVALWLVDIL